MSSKNVVVIKTRTTASIVQNIQQSLNDRIARVLADTSGEKTTFLTNDTRSFIANTIIEALEFWLKAMILKKISLRERE